MKVILNMRSSRAILLTGIKMYFSENINKSNQSNHSNVLNLYVIFTTSQYLHIFIWIKEMNNHRL